MEIELEMNKKDLREDKIYVNTRILQSHSDYIQKITKYWVTFQKWV